MKALRCINCEIYLGKYSVYREPSTGAITFWCEKCEQKKNGEKRIVCEIARRDSYINSYKLLKGCEWVNGCEYTSGRKVMPQFFDLDHIDPSKKLVKVSLMRKQITKYSWEIMVSEIAKCRVLCKFHHAILDTSTGKRRGIE